MFPCPDRLQSVHARRSPPVARRPRSHSGADAGGRDRSDGARVPARPVPAGRRPTDRESCGRPDRRRSRRTRRFDDRRETAGGHLPLPRPAGGADGSVLTRRPPSRRELARRRQAAFSGHHSARRIHRSLGPRSAPPPIRPARAQPGAPSGQAHRRGSGVHRATAGPPAVPGTLRSTHHHQAVRGDCPTLPGHRLPADGTQPNHQGARRSSGPRDTGRAQRGNTRRARRHVRIPRPVPIASANRKDASTSSSSVLVGHSDRRRQFLSIVP
ncbi:Basic proline-rich protein precursor [Rhodococcus sp. B7740]|nr:Basic proline-rich protein precursor [Rhodococcus sp. B7740]